MATIAPTLTLVSNASGAATLPGPLSVALSLSASVPELTVATVKAATITVPIAAASLFTDAAQTEGDTAGTHGSFIYFKNTSPADYDISFGFLASGTSPTAAEVYGDGALGTRVGTLKQGEFAFFPYDFAGDITIDSENAAAKLEYFFFSRT